MEITALQDHYHLSARGRVSVSPVSGELTVPGVNYIGADIEPAGARIHAAFSANTSHLPPFPPI
jgi:hypothetical protein